MPNQSGKSYHPKKGKAGGSKKASLRKTSRKDLPDVSPELDGAFKWIRELGVPGMILSRTLNRMTTSDYKDLVQVAPWILQDTIALLLQVNPNHFMAFPEDWANFGVEVVPIRQCLVPLFRGNRVARMPPAILKQADKCSLHVPPEMREAISGTRGQDPEPHGRVLTPERSRNLNELKRRKKEAPYDGARLAARDKWKTCNWNHVDMRNWIMSDDCKAPGHSHSPFRHLDPKYLLKLLKKDAIALGKPLLGTPGPKK